MRIHVNGQPREVAPGTPLTALVASLGLDLRRVAVAVNGAVIPRGELGSRTLAADDRVEIIEAVGGG